MLLTASPGGGGMIVGAGLIPLIIQILDNKLPSRLSVCLNTNTHGHDYNVYIFFHCLGHQQDYRAPRQRVVWLRECIPTILQQFRCRYSGQPHRGKNESFVFLRNNLLNFVTAARDRS